MKNFRTLFLACALTIIVSPLCMAGDASMPGVQPPDEPPPTATTNATSNVSNDAAPISSYLSLIAFGVANVIWPR